jgi:cysteinyl-tRNA synthetase
VNFTDVDDRTIAGAQKAGMDLRAYTEQFITAFQDDSRALGLELVEETPRATDEANVKAMAELIAALTRNGHTYVSDGSIYFKISTMPGYGKLAHLDHDGMQPGARIDADNYAKDDARDFVLWKATKPGEPTWSEVDPPGRPGWHLECSAMALRLLGEPPIDIHTGGIDLIFPHHENEIAQSEGATGKQFSRFWFHVEYLLVNDEKMSKSLGNTHTIPDLVERGYRPSAVRYLLLSSHYRKQLNFTWESLAASEKALQRLMALLARLDTVSRAGSHAEVEAKVAAAREAFKAAIFDDLNTAGALGAVFELVTSLNSAIDAGEFGTEDVAAVRGAFDEFDRVLGIRPIRRAEEAQTALPVEEIEQRIEDRHAARRRRDFAAADRIRDELAERGIILEDSAGKTRWKRK